METIGIKKLPENLRPLFWSYVFEDLDIETNKRLIVVQIINYGSWSAWKWLVKTYGKNDLREFIERVPATEFRPGALMVVSLLLSVQKLNYAQRGAY